MIISSRSGSATVPRLTIVVPAYNEENRLGPSLEKLAAFAAAREYPVELLVVDDGSTDGTAGIVRAKAAAVNSKVALRLIQHERNMHKGAAVRTGCRAAVGDYVVYLDADLSAPPEEILKLLPVLESGADVAIGNRVQPSGRDMRESQPLRRRLVGSLFTQVRRTLLVPSIADTQCPLKGFRRDAAQRIFALQRLSGWAFDVEILYLARRLGLTVREVPVEWQHVGDSRLQVGVAPALRVLWDLARLRWVHRRDDWS